MADSLRPLRSLTVTVAALVAISVAGCGGSGSAPEVGDRAPSYSADSLRGERVALDELRGDVVLLNAWATWCGPCREEMPYLQELSRDYSKRGLRVVGVNVDRSADEGAIESFLAEVGVTFPTVLDPADRFARTFVTSGVPESLLIDSDGTIMHRWKGPLDDRPDDTEAIIESTLAGDGAEAVADERSVAVPIAFLAGLLSFLSPCVFPLIPAYFAFITGISFDRLAARQPQHRVSRRRALRGGSLFVAGFSVVFIALGASATLLGSAVEDASSWIARIGGVLVVLFGLHLLGVLRLPGLNRQLQAFESLAGKRTSMASLTAFLAGVTFAAGWSPCIGPVLGSILTLAATRDAVSEGVVLLAIYSAGLAVPFLLVAVSLDRFIDGSRRVRRWLPWIERASGVLLVAVGVLLISGSLETLSGRLPSFDPVS